jgi:hypothetical protein
MSEAQTYSRPPALIRVRLCLKLTCYCYIGS